MIKAATDIEITPKNTSSSREKYGPIATSTTDLNRKSARKATLSNTPESKLLIGAGALLWASGSHVCMGTKPTFVPYPIKIKMNAILAINGSSAEAWDNMSCQLINPGKPACMDGYRKRKVPKNPSNNPTELIIKYFQAASIADGLL